MNRITVSVWSVVINLALSAVKLAAGVFGHSQAMVADAAHSASDVFSTLIVLGGMALARRSADRNHEYGHEKFESLSALLLSLLLIAAGLRIGLQAVESLGAAP